MNTFKERLRFYIGILLALVFSVFLSPFVQPNKHNKTIPVAPVSLNISLYQGTGILGVQSVGLANSYPSDYQSDFDSNYYLITIKNGEKILFTGKTIRSYVIVSEDFSETDIRGETIQKPLGDFALHLPYYEDATAIDITDENGQKALVIDLTKYPLTPLTVQQACGDGICADNESLLMCFSDCSYKINQKP